MNIPEFVTLAWHDELQSVVDRMARAKWITGKQFVSSKTFRLNLTALGRQRIGDACAGLVKDVPILFKGAPFAEKVTPALTGQGGDGLCVFLSVQKDLEPPKFSELEEPLFMELIVSYAYQEDQGNSLAR